MEEQRKEPELEVIYKAALEEEISSEETLDCPPSEIEQSMYEICDPGSGEICAKYIEMSRSSIPRHPYFSYPAVLDPGIIDALLKPEERKIYPYDGQQLYLDVCSEMGQCPVRSFYKGLVTDSINLKYYCVNPYGVRPMAMALAHNRNVTTLDLTDNFLNEDACFHLAEMLSTNSTLKELNLSGCRMGPSGARQLFAGLSMNRGLHSLNLNRNQLGDQGIHLLAKVVYFNIDVKKIYLSYNKLSGKSAAVLAEAFSAYNKFTHIDLSWNNLYDTIGGTVRLFSKLSENINLLELDLSWNSFSGPRIGTALSNLFKASKLQVLNLSHNQLQNEAITNMIENLRKAKKLITLNLSDNPITPQDAFTILQKMRYKIVKVRNIFMDSVYVKSDFLELLKDIKKLPFRANMVVTYGGVKGGYQTVGPDMREVVLNRVEFLCTKGKKRLMDIALVALELAKNNVNKMETKTFKDALVNAGGKLDSDLIDELIIAFAAPSAKNTRYIDIPALAEYVQRKWPDRKLPPTPLPKPEPAWATKTQHNKQDKKEQGKNK